MHESILVTGGAGFIGSHTCVELLASGRNVVVLDNLCNSHAESLARVERIAGRPIDFVHGDIRDDAKLTHVFATRRIEAVIHFAGLKAVGESVAKPLEYYENNVQGTLRLLSAMGTAGVRTLVFSSSATVYGDPHAVPINEDFPLKATNPYGRSKLMVCDMLRDMSKADARWRFALLRYFNPVGAHESGLIGEDPNGVPNNLMPFVAQVAVGRLPELSVFGSDYNTPDGTGVRDYIHVVDLARGHLDALDALGNGRQMLTLNLGTGRGYSVLEVIRAFEAASGRPVPYKFVARRPGDIAACYADPSRAQAQIGWRAEHDLARMCADHWRWQSMNPNGFKT
jgi:UDP-glucose 4-epimerase